jgi:ABC-type multidrug transport system ATPase subunit
MLAFEIRDLHKTYGHEVHANDGLDFSIETGEVFGVLGPNGAGKSTLVQQMVGLSVPTSGEIRLRGQPIRPHDRRVRRLVGYLAQRPLALYDLRAREAVVATGRLRGLSRPEAEREADALLREIGLKDRQDRLVGNLSGGEHRLVGMATALIGSPPVLILDEPTNELDPVARRRVWDMLMRRRSEGTTIILVTHNVLEAERVVGRVAIMARGRIVAIGTPGELKERLHAQVRLEVALRDGVPQAEDWLAAGRQIGERRWSLTLGRDRLGEAFRRLADPATSAEIDDLRIASPSLEDVYLAYHGEEAREDAR